METPPLLLYNTEREYIDRLQKEYHNKRITLPEGKDVLFFLGNDRDCKHVLNGKNKKFNQFRAQRILWIKFVLENEDIRIIKQRVWKQENIVFYCNRLGYVVVCNLLKNGDVKFITQYIQKRDFVQRWNDPKEYYEYKFK